MTPPSCVLGNSVPDAMVRAAVGVDGMRALHAKGIIELETKGG